MSARILLGTRKGFIAIGANHEVEAVAHAGIPVTYATKIGDTTWCSFEHGHWGPKLSRSHDDGKTWEDVAAPEYPGTTGTALDAVWVVAGGLVGQPDRVWLGTFPGGLFRSDDGGDSFDLVDSLWDHPSRSAWFGGGRDQPGIHSVVVDPNDANRLLIGVSCGGVYESADDGGSWTPRNTGLAADFLPDPEVDAGHDPHLLAFGGSGSDVVWQQNHCGIFRSTDGGHSWEACSERGELAHFGFAVATHDADPDVAWVVPGVSDEQRMAVGGALAVCRTTDGGKTWEALRDGLPQQNAWDIVYRHALDRSGDELVFGTTTGNVYWSGDGGESWATLGNNFPPIYSARFA